MAESSTYIRKRGQRPILAVSHQIAALILWLRYTLRAALSQLLGQSYAGKLIVPAWRHGEGMPG